MLLCGIAQADPFGATVGRDLAIHDALAIVHVLPGIRKYSNYYLFAQK
jgi:hypothetical protein